MSISKAAYYYKAKKREDDEEIKATLLTLSQKHKRWGFDKMMMKINQEKKHWNHKRVYRIYCELKLNIRVKPRKRLPSGDAKIIVQPTLKNICWSMDFMSDALVCGRRFRTFNVIDDYNREALLIKASSSLTSKYITRLLDEMGAIRGYPEMIRSDNGPEFRSAHFIKWAERHNIILNFIQPGKPAQNALIERFNKTFREDILDMNLFYNLKEVNQLASQWRHEYNFERPHQSLAGLTPYEFDRRRDNNLDLFNNNNSIFE